MAIQKITIEHFLSLSKEHPVFDVRSPAEFAHSYFPSAHSLPLFNDEERKVVGTTYKQQSRQQAIKVGLDYFGIKMRKLVEDVEKIVAGCQLSVASNKNPATDSDQQINGSIVLVYCWRGGMRSAALAWLLDLYGYKIYTLAGGYKTFRNWALKQFEQPYNFKILGGYTGSGKTVLIEELERLEQPVINLEGLANHKGSAFGELEGTGQPSQEMFENRLALSLFNQQGKLNNAEEKKQLDIEDISSHFIWLEDESQRIGKLHIPKPIWERMRNSPVYFIDIPFEQRLEYLAANYGTIEKEKLVNAIIRIQKRLGGLETKIAISYLLENNITECFSILLQYYDKCYSKALNNRTNLEHLLNKIPCSYVSINNITGLSSIQNKI